MVHICVLGRPLYQSMAKTWREQRLEARNQVRRLLQRHRGEVNEGESSGYGVEGR